MKTLTLILLTLPMTIVAGCAVVEKAMPVTIQWKTSQQNDPESLRGGGSEESSDTATAGVDAKLKELNANIQDPLVREALKEMLDGNRDVANHTISSENEVNPTPEDVSRDLNSNQEGPKARETTSSPSQLEEQTAIPNPSEASQRRTLGSDNVTSKVSRTPPRKVTPTDNNSEATDEAVTSVEYATETAGISAEMASQKIATVAEVGMTENFELENASPSAVANANHETPASTSEVPPAAEFSSSSKGHWKSQLSDTIASLEEQLDKNKSLTENEQEHFETVLSLCYLLASDRDSALERLDFAEPEKEAFWKELVYAVSVILEPEELDIDAPFFVGDHRRASLALDHLRKAEDGLSPLASLQVNNIILCEEVKGFGNYTAFPSSTFNAGQATIVYCEIENYKTSKTVSSRGVGPQFESEFQSSISIVNEDRQVVRQFTYQPIIDKARRRRRDFYIHYTLTIPDDLPKGNYTLSLQVEDVKAGKTTQSPPVAFRVR